MWKRAYIPANTLGSIVIVVVASLAAVLSIVLVVLRFIARRHKRIRYGIDDWLVLAALPVVLGHNCVVLTSVYLGGVGHRTSMLTPDNLAVIQKSLIALQIAFGLSLGLIKASIVSFLVRLFYLSRFNLVTRLVMGYIACWSVMCILLGAFAFRPMGKHKNPTVPNDFSRFLPENIAIASTDILGDLMIMSLPMPKIWKLQTDLKTKITLSVIFAIGILDVIVGILRVIYLERLIRTTDMSFYAVNTWIWSTMEPSLGILVACLPTLKPLLTRDGGRSSSSREPTPDRSSGSFRLSKWFPHQSDSGKEPNRCDGFPSKSGPYAPQSRAWVVGG